MMLMKAMEARKRAEVWRIELHIKNMNDTTEFTYRSSWVCDDITVHCRGFALLFWFQEKERLKREKNNERHLSKMRRLELRRQELELAKQLKKPNEDMCLADHKVWTRCRGWLSLSICWDWQGFTSAWVSCCDLNENQCWRPGVD